MLRDWGRRFEGVAPRTVIFLAAWLVALLYAFFWRLGSLTPGLSRGANSAAASRSWHNILNHPVNAPYAAFHHLITTLGHASPLYDRLAAAIIAVLFVFLFYKLAVGWFGRASGLLGTILFVCTPLLVISARQSAPDIMFFSPIALMTAYWWLSRGRDHIDAQLILLTTVAGLAIYIPGLIWIMAAGLLITQKRLAIAFNRASKPVLAGCIALFIVLLIPLIVASARDIGTIKQVLLIPGHISSIGPTLSNIGWMASALFVKSPAHQSLVLGRLPVLDIIQTAFLAFGLYAMFNVAAKKAYPLLAIIIFAIIMAGFNQSIAILGLAAPSMAIFICAGLRYLYIEWHSVFPRNPVPETFAITLMVLVVAMSAIYGLRYSLTAWPHAPATRQSYVLK